MKRSGKDKREKNENEIFGERKREGLVIRDHRTTGDRKGC
jgi:hypothetical protein